MNNISNCKDRIIKIINKVADKTIEFDELSDYPLTGDKIGITDYQMVYIVLELIEEFSIHFDAEDFNSYKFVTLNSVADIVETKLKNT